MSATCSTCSATTIANPGDGGDDKGLIVSRAQLRIYSAAAHAAKSPNASATAREAVPEHEQHRPLRPLDTRIANDQAPSVTRAVPAARSFLFAVRSPSPFSLVPRRRRRTSYEPRGRETRDAHRPPSAHSPFVSLGAVF